MSTRIQRRGTLLDKFRGLPAGTVLFSLLEPRKIKWVQLVLVSGYQEAPPLFPDRRPARLSRKQVYTPAPSVATKRVQLAPACRSSAVPKFFPNDQPAGRLARKWFVRRVFWAATVREPSRDCQPIIYREFTQPSPEPVWVILGGSKEGASR